MPSLPFRVPHAPTFEPDSEWKPEAPVPWWRDEKYNVGRETARPVYVRVMNALAKRTATIKVNTRRRKSREKYCFKNTRDIILY